MTDDVFTYWVNSELRTSMRSSKGVIAVVETDPRHGGVSADQLRSQCPKDIAGVLFDKQKPIKWHREVSRIHRVPVGPFQPHDVSHMPGSFEGDWPEKDRSAFARMRRASEAP